MGSIRNDAEPIAVLSISKDEHDHASLQNVFGHVRWVIVKATDVASARSVLKKENISVVVFDCDSISDDWRKIVDIAHPASIIVASRLADDRLWTDALAGGAWDVLPKPFQTAELLRTVRCAWEHSRRQTGRRSKNVVSVAS